MLIKLLVHVYIYIIYIFCVQFCVYMWGCLNMCNPTITYIVLGHLNCFYNLSLLYSYFCLYCMFFMVVVHQLWWQSKVCQRGWHTLKTKKFIEFMSPHLVVDWSVYQSSMLTPLTYRDLDFLKRFTVTLTVDIGPWKTIPKFILHNALFKISLIIYDFCKASY